MKKSSLIWSIGNSTSNKMLHKFKIKLVGLLVLSLSIASLLVHLYLASSSSGDWIYQKLTIEEILHFGKVQKIRLGRLWGPVMSFEVILPYANPRSRYPVPSEMNNGFIYAKIYGGFEEIRSSICDLVTISRLLNATLVIPEIQQSIRSKGISRRFNSFSYLYNEDQFIAALTNDVIVVKSLPQNLKEARKENKFPLIQPGRSSSLRFYTEEVLLKLKKAKVIGLVITGGGCLQSILPQSMAEFQRLRCRVAFHALHFRSDIQALGNLIIERLRAFGQPYLAYHPGLVRDKLAFHGCGELFQDLHTELIQYRREQMIKHGVIHEELNVDSVVRKLNGSCPLMPEEVGLLLKAIGYPPDTIIYLAGAETFGGQRAFVPLHALYNNVVDRTSLCSKKELLHLMGPESPLPYSPPWSSPAKSEKELITLWKKAGPRPRPLPPPPARPYYSHEKEGWYGWVVDYDGEQDPSPVDLRMQAHRLLWDALDYYVSVEADAFFPGFNNDGSGSPDFSGLVMGHRLYMTPSSITYRPDRKTVAELFDRIRDHMYHPKRNWTLLIKEQLNKGLGVEGLIKEYQLSKPTVFLSHPFPECFCRTSDSNMIPRPDTSPYGIEDKCPEWMVHDLKLISSRSPGANDEGTEDPELSEDDLNIDGQTGSEANETGAGLLSEQDEDMDADD